MSVLILLNYPYLKRKREFFKGRFISVSKTDYKTFMILRSGNPVLQVNKNGKIYELVDVPLL